MSWTQESSFLYLISGDIGNLEMADLSFDSPNLSRSERNIVCTVFLFHLSLQNIMFYCDIGKLLGANKAIDVTLF
jgi:hypothetical protein